MKQIARSADLDLPSNNSKGVAYDSGYCKTCCAYHQGGKYRAAGCGATTDYGNDICPRTYEGQRRCSQR